MTHTAMHTAAGHAPDRDVSAAGAPILIAYDGSENARHAIDWAGELFPGRHAVVLYAWEPVEGVAARHGGIGSTAGLSAAGSLRDADAWGHDAAVRVAAAGAELARAAGLDAEARVEQGALPVWELIVRAADEVGASLVVLGSRGLRGLRSLVLGSVSHQVAHHAHQSVVVVPMPSLTDARRARTAGEPNGAGTSERAAEANAV
jgi:nucleotide-binding universal stress UspA family protein